MTGIAAPQAILPFDFEPVQDKRILVTGGTTGIGRAVSLLLASLGARILVLGRHQPELDSIMREARRHGKEIAGMTADVADQHDLERVFRTVDEQFRGLDVLINNAGLGAGETAASSYPEIDYVVRTNLIAYMACARAAVERMERGGIIVNIGSMSATVREEGGSVYVATKAGIEGFSESLRKELNPRGIHVSLIEPGAVATDMQPMPPEEQSLLEIKEEMLSPQDVAMSILFCLIQPARSDVVLIRVRPHQQLI
ncbi:MAG TPA: SDR family oxidoreductase [Acidimicrobiia bacterium]|nr:SDR family oxidoreductase [Acidimicrobiia bacterium]